MTAIGFGLALAGYATFMLGYCWLRDYNVTLKGLFATTWPGSGTGKGTVSSQVLPTPGGQPQGGAQRFITGQ